MGFREVYEWLMNELEGIEIVDAHEHLPPERERISRDVDVFTLFSHYTHADLIAAGMRRDDYERILDSSVALDERWSLFKPYYKAAKYTSYFRAARIALKEFYGEEDLTDENYRIVSERVSEANKPGLYKRILKDKCHIKAVLTQIGRIPEEDRDLLIPILPMDLLTGLSSQKDVDKFKLEGGIDVRSIADYTSLVKEKLKEWKHLGVVGLKMSARNVTEVSEETANNLFTDLLNGELKNAQLLQDFLTDKVIEMATELGLVIAVHTGIIWTNWMDFTKFRPTLLIPLLMRHRNAKFDVYHAGIPWVREVGVMGKSFPNIWLNLCWCHIISQKMTCSALDEWIDLVPVNKIIGFGGDYNLPVEKVYGHLVMAREDIAEVLARRVVKGLMKRREALDTAYMWLYENPKELYGLHV